MESGNLPEERHSLRAAVVDNHIYLTGGKQNEIFFNSILHWDPSTESWQQVGHLTVKRSEHAAVGVPASIIESECSAIILKSSVM